MAKKKTSKPADPPEKTDADPADRSPKVRSAAGAVGRAEEELEKAKAAYEKIRGEAVDRVRDAREKTLGDLIDGTLNCVKKHPGPGVLFAVLIGFFLGRLFRK